MKISGLQTLKRTFARLVCMGPLAPAANWAGFLPALYLT